jgi:integrase/recombinase XerD
MDEHQNSFPISPTAAAILQGFQRDLKVKGYKASTEQMLVTIIKELLHQLESRCIFQIDKVTSEDILEHYYYICARPSFRSTGKLSSSMLNHHVYAMRTFFSWLEQMKAIDSNPMLTLNFPRKFSTSRKSLTKADIKMLYQTCEDDRDRVIMSLFYACGLRRTEGTDLDCKDIRYTECKLIVREGKFSKRREIPLNSKAMEYLRSYQATQRESLVAQNEPDLRQPFLLNNFGKRMTGSSCINRLKYIAGKAGLQQSKITLHHLRHSIATHLKENGMPIAQIQEYLGHGSVDVTQGYLHSYRINWNWQKKHKQKMRFKE